jgi:hypothetical protein
MPVLSLMRVMAATGIVIGLAAIAGAAEAREYSSYRGSCGEVALPAAPAGLPRAVDVATECGRFRINLAGRVVAIRSSWRPFGASPADGRGTLLMHDPATGVKTVFLRAVGVSSPRPVYSYRSRTGLSFGSCTEPPLDWNGRWLLYRSPEGHLVAVESRTLRLVDLTATVSRLPGAVDAAAWA